MSWTYGWHPYNYTFSIAIHSSVRTPDGSRLLPSWGGILGLGTARLLDLGRGEQDEVERLHHRGRKAQVLLPRQAGGQRSVQLLAAQVVRQPPHDQTAPPRQQPPTRRPPEPTSFTISVHAPLRKQQKRQLSGPSQHHLCYSWTSEAQGKSQCERRTVPGGGVRGAGSARCRRQLLRRRPGPRSRRARRARSALPAAQAAAPRSSPAPAQSFLV